jgi:hypothetical protein
VSFSSACGASNRGRAAECDGGEECSSFGGTGSLGGKSGGVLFAVLDDVNEGRGKIWLICLRLKNFFHSVHHRHIICVSHLVLVVLNQFHDFLKNGGLHDRLCGGVHFVAWLVVGVVRSGKNAFFSNRKMCFNFFCWSVILLVGQKSPIS